MAQILNRQMPEMEELDNFKRQWVYGPAVATSQMAAELMGLPTMGITPKLPYSKPKVKEPALPVNLAGKLGLIDNYYKSMRGQYDLPEITELRTVTGYHGRGANYNFPSADRAKWWGFHVTENPEIAQRFEKTTQRPVKLDVNVDRSFIDTGDMLAWTPKSVLMSLYENGHITRREYQNYIKWLDRIEMQINPNGQFNDKADKYMIPYIKKLMQEKGIKGFRYRNKFEQTEQNPLGDTTYFIFDDSVISPKRYVPYTKPQVTTKGK